MVQQAERDDQLILLAGVVQLLGGKGLAGYEPPSQTMEDKITEAVTRAGLPVHEPEDSRYDQVMAFVAVAGGDAASG